VDQTTAYKNQDEEFSKDQIMHVALAVGCCIAASPS
jgi:hypothetical protein